MNDATPHHLVGLVAIRDAVKLHLKTGLSLGPAETARFVQRLNTVIELVRNQDEQHRIDGLTLLAYRSFIRANRETDDGAHDPSVRPR